MPYHIGEHDSCPAAKPHAVVKDSDGKLMGCHPTEAAAKKQMAALHAQEPHMASVGTDRHPLALKAATRVETDQGLFTAVISTGGVDRQKDIVDPDRMVEALQKWAAVGKQIPLDWNHGDGPADQIGHVKAETARNVDGEVVVDGWVDQSTENGEHVWRLVKSGTLGFSFYGLIPRESVVKRKGGGVHIQGEFDVAAVTATPTPVNNQTRVLAWKALATVDVPAAVVDALAALKDELDDEAKVDLLRKAQDVLGVQQAEVTDKEPPVRSVDPLKKQARDVVLDIRSGGASRKPPMQEQPQPREVPEHLAQKREFKRLMVELLSE